MKNKEIERKFLVDFSKIPYDLTKLDYCDITQGYVKNINDDNYIFRLRQVLYRTPKSELYLGEEFFQTIKGKGSKIRDEFEIKLLKNQFSELWKLCNNYSIHKYRYELPVKDNIIYLDNYKNELSGLYVVEVEFDTIEDCNNYVPEYWFGDEITNNKKYTNYSLALYGLKNNRLNNMRERGFEIVSDEFRKHKEHDVKLPLRGSKTSAGYDFYSNEDVVIKPNESHLFWTDIKAYMKPDEVLKIYVRSSIGIKKGLILKNTVGIIDHDYFANPKNDGNVGVCLQNIGLQDVEINNGERIAQGIFQKYLESDNCNSEDERTGGIGSTT